MTTTNTPFEDGLDEILAVHLNEIKAGHDGKLKDSITQLHEAAVLAELERINKANIDNGINFYFEDMKDKSDGWRTMRQYIPERSAALNNKSKR